MEKSWFISAMESGTELLIYSRNAGTRRKNPSMNFS
jgi:hypothetical protein